jgi:hypothetical protein
MEYNITPGKKTRKALQIFIKGRGEIKRKEKKCVPKELDHSKRLSFLQKNGIDKPRFEDHRNIF